MIIRPPFKGHRGTGTEPTGPPAPTPCLAALGHEVTEWPPYLSNLVLELWQLQPRSPSVEPRYVVRVIYNQQELPLPHCPPGEKRTSM